MASASEGVGADSRTLSTIKGRGDESGGSADARCSKSLSALARQRAEGLEEDQFGCLALTVGVGAHIVDLATEGPDDVVFLGLILVALGQLGAERLVGLGHVGDLVAEGEVPGRDRGRSGVGAPRRLREVEVGPEPAVAGLRERLLSAEMGVPLVPEVAAQNIDRGVEVAVGVHEVLCLPDRVRPLPLALLGLGLLHAEALPADVDRVFEGQQFALYAVRPRPLLAVLLGQALPLVPPAEPLSASLRGWAAAVTVRHAG